MSWTVSASSLIVSRSALIPSPTGERSVIDRLMGRGEGDDFGVALTLLAQPLEERRTTSKATSGFGRSPGS